MFGNGSRNEKMYIVILDQSDGPLLKDYIVSPLFHRHGESSKHQVRFH